MLSVMFMEISRGTFSVSSSSDVSLHWIAEHLFTISSSKTHYELQLFDKGRKKKKKTHKSQKQNNNGMARSFWAPQSKNLVCL